MNDLDYDFILQDRIAKIQSIDIQYDLKNNSYIAFSGGKDSFVLSELIDMALPGNKIPRVFSNTGIEYIDIVKFVKEKAKHDDRFVIMNQDLNIKKTLNQYGYPFKSKEHSQRVDEARKSYKKHGYLLDYLYRYKEGIKDYVNKNGETKHKMMVCPSKLKYQFEKDCNLNISKMCCDKLKKRLGTIYQKQSGKKITITGMRKEEGGNRIQLSCLSHNNTKFNPLSVISDEWEEEFIKRNDIKLCKLYYPPYNFKRTGCVGCPYNKNLQNDLNILYELLPNEYKQCLHIWKPIYDEYIRIGFRLKEYPHEKGIQYTIFDYLGEYNE